MSKQGLIKQDGTITEALSNAMFRVCLLYTSDAADERSSVDLGGRRIIKKKKYRKKKRHCRLNTENNNEKR